MEGSSDLGTGGTISTTAHTWLAGAGDNSFCYCPKIPVFSQGMGSVHRADGSEDLSLPFQSLALLELMCSAVPRGSPLVNTWVLPPYFSHQDPSVQPCHLWWILLFLGDSFLLYFFIFNMLHKRTQTSPRPPLLPISFSSRLLLEEFSLLLWILSTWNTNN